MKKEFAIFGLVLLLAITIMAVIRESDIKQVATVLEEDNNKLTEEVTALEKEIENTSTTSKELVEENTRLEEEISELEEEVKGFKTSINYQDFMDAIHTVESFNKAKTFEEAAEFVSLGIGRTMIDSKGTCPCGFIFISGMVDWIPNAVLYLREFRNENEKIYLTYQTIETIKRNYEFVLLKDVGIEGNELEWRIEDIKFKAKEK